MIIEVIIPEGVGEVECQDHTTVMEIFDIVRARVGLSKDKPVTITCKQPPEGKDSEALNQPLQTQTEQTFQSGEDGLGNKKRRFSPADVELRAQHSAKIKRLCSMFPQNDEHQYEHRDGARSCPPGSPRSDAPAEISEESIVTVQINGSDANLIRRNVDEDGDCTFNAVGCSLRGDPSRPNEEFEANSLRRLVTDYIREQSQDNTEGWWCAGALGDTSVDDYCRKMLKQGVWGGGTELQCLSEIFGVEIVVVAIQTGKEHIFGEEKGYESRCIILFTGSHYDRVAEIYDEAQTTDSDITRWDVSNSEGVMQAARELAAKLKDEMDKISGEPSLVPADSLPELRPNLCIDYTPDLSSYKVRCRECGAICEGRRSVVNHTNSTGHWTGFTEDL